MEPIFIGSSDNEDDDDEIAFVGSTMGLPNRTR